MKVIGNTVGTSVPRSDWAETNPRKASFIKNKPEVLNGKDGVDGKDGTDGQDGVSPVVSVSTITGGHRITITDKNGTKTVDVMDGTDGSDGSDGRDGTSCTHRWSGTTLYVTSASGTTSANLKGQDGTNGKDGSNGYTPVRGTDYWTPTDIAEIKSYVDNAILGGEW